jgi:hypothetical protein
VIQIVCCACTDKGSAAKYYGVFARIVEAGFASRIIPGSDFPVPHYFRTKYPKDNEEPSISLQEQYAKDVARMKEYEKRIRHSLIDTVTVPVILSN